MKILALGNEFLEIDSLAKRVGENLKSENEVVFVKDSYELMSIISEDTDFVILDVVLGLNDVRKISVDQLSKDSIMSAHDFDASYVLQLMGEDVKIIGIPVAGDVLKITGEVRRLIASPL